MKWSIPAKTFLLGEYAAIAEQSALLLTTAPYFELALAEQETNPMHPESPAGLWWQKQGLDAKLSWFDPYHGRGGLGASSAQFLSCYLAASYLNHQPAQLQSMLQAYYQVAWSGKGLRPSGYDVMAQSQRACVYINKQRNIIQSFDWPFTDLSFLLLHTGVKLATHHHLQDSALPSQINQLSAIVDDALKAFHQTNSSQLIDSVNNYHQKLVELNRVAPHSLELIDQLKNHQEILAIKGCGALGADILLILCARSDKLNLKNKLNTSHYQLMASESELTKQPVLLEKNR